MTLAGAIDDFRRGLALWPFFGRLGIDDIRQRYVRTALGPFWMIISSAMRILVMAMLTARLFGQDLSKTFPFVAGGMYAWLFIASPMSEATGVYISQQWQLNSLTLPTSFQIWRYMVRVCITILHYLPVLAVILVISGVHLSWHMLWSLPALLAFVVMALWLGTVLGPLSMRYRDIPHIVTTIMSAIPIISPIAWDRDFLKSHHWIADLNPVYHFVEIFRGPLLGKPIAVESWLVVIAINLGGLALAMMVFAKSRTKLAMWI